MKIEVSLPWRRCLSALAVLAAACLADAKPAGSFQISAWTFGRGNAKVHADQYLYADYGDNYPALIAGDGGEVPWVVEYDLDFPVDAEYTLHIRYGSPEPRPAEYDFFGRARYPGPGTVPAVDRYTVEQAGGPHADGYRRRVVNWWPRKGVDVIAIRDGMPLRTWTLRDRQLNPAACALSPRIGAEEITRRLTPTQARRFRAHLIGFRGIGNRIGDPFEHSPFYCPAAVLRLQNGTKRCFTRGTFVEEDERYLLDLYLHEIERVRATLSKASYELSSGTISGWPDNAKPGEPGTMRVESEHFVWVAGSQHAPNEAHSPWVNRDEPDKARLYREGSVTFAEDMWAYQEHAGVLMPYWDRTRQYKYEITVCGTYRDGHRWLGGYAGGGYGGCGIKHAGGGPWSLGLAHEWGHGLPLQTSVDGGGGEILADACQVVDDPARTEKFANNVRRPWRNCVHGSYGTGLFYGIMADDPNWGYAMVIALPVGKEEPSIFHTLARVGEQRGLFTNGIRGVGDMVGEFSARQAEFDCELQDTLRRGYISVKRNYLEAVDRKAGLFRIPWAEAPEPFGANIIRLVPIKGDSRTQEPGRITVDFRGFHDPDTYGDWRVCIIAVGGDGRVRYSPLWNKGLMEMALRPDDRRFWLTVAATPSALPHLPGKRGLGVLLDGRHAYRYPYEVKLSGCRPGTPHNRPGDTDDYALTNLGQFRRRDTGGLCVIPHPGDTPQAEIMRTTMPTLQSKLAAFKEKIAQLTTEGKLATGNWWYTRRFAPNVSFLATSVAQMLDGMNGARHQNGGGWVAASAEVAPTAYVAPDAMVLGGAKVLDQAAIEDYAVVRGPGAIVKGHAKVGGQAYVSGRVTIDGYMRVLHPLVATDKPVVPNEVPLRPFQEKGEGDKLWANHAFDREEKEVLEDWFRYRNNHGICWQFNVLNLNGHLHGQPAFVVDGDRRGFHFDGRTQYAEASPLLADLGAITIALALKWEGGAKQALFDFGTSTENRIMLTPAGDSGKPELLITHDGTTDRIVANAALPKDTWAGCRIEIDGERIALWIDDRKVAEKRTEFRPADVFPAGVEKRNFLAVSRDGTGHFKGILDYLRVYHTVFDDFSAAPAPRRHAPRRVTREFIASSRKEYGGADLRDSLIDATMRPAYAHYEEIGRKRDQRIKEIEESSPAVAEARRTLGEVRAKLDRRRSALRATFEKLPETIKKQAERRKLEERTRELEVRRNALVKAGEAEDAARHKTIIEADEKAIAEARERQKEAETELRRLEKWFESLSRIAAPDDEAQRAIRYAELRLSSKEYLRGRTIRDHAAREAQKIATRGQQRLRSLIENDPAIAALERESRRCRARAGTLRTDPGPYVDKQTAALRQQVVEAEMAVGDAVKKNIARYKPEYDWLYTFRWLAFSGHYNYPYRRYLREKIAKDVGGTECHEDFGSLESIYTAQTTAKWHTRCDWEWRLSQEVDGSIADLPLLRRWLERVRGSVREKEED